MSTFTIIILALIWFTVLIGWLGWALQLQQLGTHLFNLGFWVIVGLAATTIHLARTNMAGLGEIPMDDQALGFFALTPWWFRLLLLWLAVGWFLASYQAKRDAGVAVFTAVIETLGAALLGPILFAKVLISEWQANRKQQK